jgi:hypothetical protein
MTNPIKGTEPKTKKGRSSGRPAKPITTEDMRSPDRLKRCCKCAALLPETEFGTFLRKNGSRHIRTRCRECCANDQKVIRDRRNSLKREASRLKKVSKLKQQIDELLLKLNALSPGYFLEQLK